MLEATALTTEPPPLPPLLTNFDHFRWLKIKADPGKAQSPKIQEPSPEADQSKDQEWQENGQDEDEEEEEVDETGNADEEEEEEEGEEEGEAEGDWEWEYYETEGDADTKENLELETDEDGLKIFILQFLRRTHSSNFLQAGNESHHNLSLVKLRLS